MNDLGIDLFDALGKKWLAVVCRFSGYAWLSQLQKYNCVSFRESGKSLLRIWISKLNQIRWRTPITIRVCRILQDQKYLS